MRIKRVLLAWGVILCAAQAARAAGPVSIAPLTVAEGASVQTTTLTFIVPAGGFTTGGGITVLLPFGWGPFPQNTTPGGNGYVTALSNPAQTLVIIPSNQQASVEVTLAGGQSLAIGSTIQVMISNLWVNCPSPSQSSSIIWTVSSRPDSVGPFTPVAPQPTQSLIVGTAKYVGFNPWDVMTVVRSQVSPAIVIEGRSGCGHTAPMPSTLILTLSGMLSNFTASDPNALFASDAGFSNGISTVTLTAGATQAAFYYKTTSVGNNLAVRADYLDLQGGTATNISRTVNVLNAAVTFGALSLDDGTSATGSSAYALTPNNDGSNDFVFIRFTPSDATLNWRVRISSDGFNSWVYERWGMGNPLGTLQWDGRNMFSSGAAGSIVPNGTYLVRVEIPGLTPNDSLSITLSGASISGRVLLGGVGVANAWVNANATTGYGYGGAVTDAGGNYTIYGLISGKNYNLFSNFYSTTTQTQLNGSLPNVPAGTTTADIPVSLPAIIRVAAVLNSSPTYPLFGQVNAHTANYSQNQWSSIRVQVGSTTSDNGDSFNPSTWTVLVVQPGNFTVDLNLPGFPTASQSVTATGGVTVDVPVFNMTRPANVYGWITLPSTRTMSTWVSVEGVRSGNTYPTVWGGAYFNIGVSSSIYQVFNVPAGAYTFRARTPGFIPVSTSAVVAGSDIGDYVNGGLDISSSSFSTGGKITGTITVQGDSSALGTTFNLWINAYSPTTGTGESTQVTLATNTSSTSGSYQIGGLADGVYQVNPPYISGFELTPPGPKSVTVAGTVGTLNLLLKQNTGSITGTLTLPGANVDYSSVTLSVVGPTGSTTAVATAATYVIPYLGSGFYDLTASYATTGAQVRQSVAVVNGSTSSLNFDLSASTYGITGTITIQSAFTVSSSSGATVTINTIGDMMASSTTQVVYINNSQKILSTARVEAFPKRFDTFGNSNRAGFGNSFFGADYKSGDIQADGTYAITGLTPGVWEINVYPFLVGGQTPSLAAAKQTLTITNANKTADFGLSAGNSVGGTISLPGGSTDNRTFSVQILTERGDYLQSSQLQLGAAGSPASSATYLFKNLPSGRYVLMVLDPGSFDSTLQQTVRKYVAKPTAFEITGADITTLNITLARASRIIGKLTIQGKNLDGTPSSTLVTSNSTNLLPDNFRVAAQANPWVEGGYQEAMFGMGGHVDIDPNNQFHIDGLVPGIYDVQFRQDSFGVSFVSQGAASLAFFVKGQVLVSEGQIVDLGTIELKQGISLTGTVQDTSGNLLPNIRVRARASGNHDDYNNSEAFTNAAGQFTLAGLNPDLKSYDVVVAPRPNIGDITPPSAFGQVIKKAIDVTQTPLPTLSVTLTAANASLSGRVFTFDGGPFGFPDGDKQQGYPAAAIYLQQQGVPITGDNPLGDIREATRLDGTYTISSLVPGKYDVQIVSLNYKPVKFVVTIVAGSNSTPDVTLQSGAVLNATLAKPDGSGVNTNDVNFAVAVTADLGTIIFGQLQTDDNTKTVRSIRFSGFDSTKRYTVLLFDKRDNITTPNEGRNLAFTSDSEEKTLALTFQPTAPTAYTQVRKVGAAVEVTFYFSRALRNTLPADNLVTSLMTVVSGNGALSAFTISGDRRGLTVLYTPPADEQTATLRFSGSTSDVDPATGSEFPISKTIILRFGQRAVSEKNISPVLGGEVTLAESANDPSGVSVPANALLSSTGAIASIDTNYAISFTATEDLADIVTAAPGRGRRANALGAQMARGQAAYLPEAYQAMQSARASAVVDPFSSFYSVLLPAGLSHTLNQTAALTLQYDTNADPALINVYYFDGAKYLIESVNRTIDTVNHTITVDVSHFSTFVVLQNSLPVVVTDGGSGTLSDIDVMNFPNPFDLTSKTKTLNPDHGLGATMSTDGTIIRYFVPAAKAGAAHIDIFNVVGEKVRSIDLGAPSVDTYHYVAWDGLNTSGHKVASGVYIGVLKVGGDKKFWKMAVIK